MIIVQFLHSMTSVEWCVLLAVLIVFLVSIKIYVQNVKQVITFSLKIKNVMPYALMGSGRIML